MSVRILNVNDSPSNRYYVTRVLQAAGFEVIEAATGAEGLAMARAQRPEIAILDIKLPDMSGLEVCRELRADPVTRGMIIVQTSATFVTSEGKARGFESGADQYLTQPFESVELVAMVRSLLKLRDKEMEARETAAQLVEADKRKDEFLAMLAHELRNPLSAISVAASLLETTELDTRGAKLTGTILRQTRNLARLIDDLLDVSRITRGKIELQLEKVDFGALVRRFVEGDAGTIARKHEVTLEIAPEPLWVSADPTRLEQILLNLLGNAVKYTPTGGIIHVKLEQDEGGKTIALSVTDSGIGIHPDKIGSIFDLFFQVDDSLARSQGGLGIGLTMVKRLVELHHGKVAARSEGPGRGAQLRVELPRVDPPAVSALQRQAGVAAPSYSVLLVDDNVDSNDLQAFAFEHAGHRVKTAHDGDTGLALALGESYDVGVVDIGLPGVDGYTIARRVRTERKGDPPVLIAVTGYGRAEDKRRALEAGFDAHFAKPVDQALLADTIARILAERRSAKRSA